MSRLARLSLATKTFLGQIAFRNRWPARWRSSTSFHPAYPQEQKNDDFISPSNFSGRGRCRIRRRTALEWKASVSSGLVSTAEARVGRPLTPVSYAGVARRTTRRAVAAGAAVGAASAYYGSSCVQVVDAYGRVTIRFGAVAPYVSDAGSRQRRPDTASVDHSEPRRKRNG